MKKRALALLMTAAMMTGLLSGCGNTAPEETGSKEAVSTGAEESAGGDTQDDAEYYIDEDGNSYKKFDDVRLTMLICWNGGTNVASDQYNNDVAKAIREKIGVTVEFEGIMMSEAEKLNLMFASGEMPDIVNAPYWGGSTGESTVIRKAGVEGLLIDVKDLVPQYSNISDAFDIGLVSRKYLEDEIDYPENNGARYIMPSDYSNVLDKTNWAYGVFVRGDVAEALGVDPTSIKTSEELYDFMVKAKEYGFKDVNGNDCIVATTFHNGWNYSDFAQSFNGKKLTSYSLDENGNVVFDKLSEGYVERNMFIWKLVHEGILDKECFTTSDERANEKVGNGTALFTCAQYGMTINATKMTGLYDSHPEMRYVPVGPIQFSDGSDACQISSEGCTGSAVIFFPKTCSNIEAAMTWFNYVNSKEGTKLTCYGFEGDTYELNEDGQPRMTAELTARYAEDSDGVTAELRERGIGYIQGRTYINKKNFTWFGESNPFEADAENEYIKAYKEIRPIEVIPGYQIDSVASGYENYTEFSEWAFDESKEKEYVEAAYFLDSEDAARAQIEKYQEYLRTNNNSEMQTFLDYMTEQSKTRDDFAY